VDLVPLVISTGEEEMVVVVVAAAAVLNFVSDVGDLAEEPAEAAVKDMAAIMEENLMEEEMVA
jgi:hypothetical protein